MTKSPSGFELEAQLVWGASFLALGEALGSRIDLHLELALRELGVDLRKPFPAHPRAVWRETVELCLPVLFPTAPRREAERGLGLALMNWFCEGAVGLLMRKTLSLVGPRGAMQRFPQSVRFDNNFVVATTTQLEATHWHVTLESADFPEVTAGVLTRALLISGASNPAITVSGAQLEVHWDSPAALS